LIAHWPFDEGSGSVTANTLDASYNGTLDGATWEATGQSGSAIRFDGIDDRVSIPGGFNISGSAFTIALWFKADDFDVNDARLISKATSTATEDHLWMLGTNSNGDIYLRARLGTQGTTDTLHGDSGVLPTQQWVHAALVYDGSALRIYQDASLVGSQVKTGTVDTDTNVGVAIGNQPAGAGSTPFDGVIDEVRIYDRALSVSELQQLMGQ
jgi:hypothetical protein